MRQNRKLTIGLDVDDVLFDCMGIAVSMVNERCGTLYKVEDVTSWGFDNFQPGVQSCFIDVFMEGGIYDMQQPLPGAAGMVDALLDRGHEVIFISAVLPKHMGKRAEQLMRSFGRVPGGNIMLGARKDLVHFDVLLDDAVHNLVKTKAEYPVMFRRPWNSSLSGCLSVGDYDGFLGIVDRIAETGGPVQVAPCDKPLLIALVGPSGSGKTEITRELCKSPAYGEALSHTTRGRRPGEAGGYHFVSDDEFSSIEGSCIETTVYAGNRYGLTHGEGRRHWDDGRHAVKPVDISGAARLRHEFGNRVITVFVRRDRKAVIQDIVTRSVPPEDKVRRIMSLDAEYGNEASCDFVALNSGTVESAASQIFNYVSSVR